MKSEWEEVILEDLGFVGRGKSRHRPRNADFLYGSEYPFVQTADVKAANFRITSYSQMYSKEGLKQSKLWPVNTLCITIAANIADAALLGIEACFPDSVIGFIPDDKKSDVRFAKYLFDLLQARIKKISQGAAQDNLSLEKLRTIKFLIPNLPTQRKIAAILSAYDDAIENNLKRIKLLEEKAQLTYEEWFVRMKFPGHKNVAIDKENGLPEGWEKGKIVDLFELQRGFDLPVQNRVEGLVPVIASTGVVDYHNLGKVKGPGIVTGRSGTIGEVQFVADDFWPLNTTLWIKKYKKGNPAYALQFLKAIKLKRFAGGAAVPSLDRKVVHHQSIRIPTPELIENYETFCNSILTAIIILQNQNQLFKEARNILLPRLMTGMIDVEELELPTSNVKSAV